MPYTDLTTEFSYKDLLTWTNLDALAENTAIWAGTHLAPGPIRITNDKFIQWRNNAGSLDLDGWRITTADKLEAGTDLKDPVADGDPVHKKYVDDATKMILQTQPKISFTSAGGTALDTGTGKKGLLHAIRAWNSSGSDYTGRVKVTIDGTLIFDAGPFSVPAGLTRWIVIAGEWTRATPVAETEQYFNPRLDLGFTDRLEIYWYGGHASYPICEIMYGLLL